MGIFGHVDEDGSDGDTLTQMNHEADEFEKELESVDMDGEESRDEAMSTQNESTKDEKPTTPAAAKTGARPGISKPATRTPKETSKKKRKADMFADLAGAEEVTRQKELDVAKAKAEENKARIELKRAKLADKAERRKEKMEEKAAKMWLLELRRPGNSHLSHSHPHNQPPPAPSTPYSQSSHSLGSTSQSNHPTPYYSAGPSTPFDAEIFDHDASTPFSLGNSGTNQQDLDLYLPGPSGLSHGSFNGHYPNGE